MKNVRQLCSAVVLALVLAMSAMAGETQTPPGCTDPGETQGPSCSRGEMQGHGPAAAGDMESSMLRILLFAMQSILPG